jgi:hypothetical protein
MKDALAQQGKGSSTIHHALDELDLSHLALHLAVVDGAGQTCSHGLLVLLYPMSEARPLWYLAFIEPP